MGVATARTADIAVTGLGVLSPVGLTPEANWAGLCRGRSVAAYDAELAGLPVDFSCRVPGFDAAAELGARWARRTDRFSQFAVAAARRAVADAGLDPGAWDGERVGVVLGVGSNSLHTYTAEFRELNDDRPDRVSPLALPRSVPNMAAGEVAMDLGACGPGFTTASACASGATAIGVARDLLRGGACDVVLAGGSESACCRMSATCFARLRALSRRTAEPELASRPFDADRDGFVLGEGAAVLVMERYAGARARGAQVRALLRGYGATSDAHHPIAPLPDGSGAARAIRIALRDAECAPREIGHVNAHGTSTRLNDAAEAAALSRVFGQHPPPVTAPKSVVGHALGAAGALEAAYTVLSLEHQVIPPIANFGHQDGDHKLDVVAGAPRRAAMSAAITCSFGFGGHNAVLVFTTE
ncbi:beta-ketoacyl-[acyl-carrier-protein] synthase family protein [Streptomyces buecherae]|uniref:beta-ketoacyl-[acyl-carrier-protein] synthase family protein n=1 Tax=Streptomyces buecherae TaxID=2763006 RepID=UPI001C265620|nr:beta-ketoacyl-[acyl-carrier-protein] synthase family protein [Streptomyces buecherae]